MVVAQDRFAFLVDEELLEVPPHVAVLKRRVEQARSCRVEDLLSWRAVRLEQKTSYRGRELPQVSFLSRQTFCHDKRMFVATNTCLWRQNTSFFVFSFCDKSMLAATISLAGAATSIIFVATNVLSRQNTSFLFPIFSKSSFLI